MKYARYIDRDNIEFVEGVYPVVELETPKANSKPQYQFVEAVENDINASYIAVTYEKEE